MPTMQHSSGSCSGDTCHDEEQKRFLGCKRPVLEEDSPNANNGMAREVEYNLLVPCRDSNTRKQRRKQRHCTFCGLRLSAAASVVVVVAVFFVLLALHKTGAFTVLNRAMQLWPIIGIHRVSSVAPASPSPSPSHQTRLESRHPARRRAAVCNVTAPEPQLASSRKWDLGPGWMRVCEKKLNERHLTVDRNWCWMGMKAQCHEHLKAHFPWAKLQSMASGSGSAPSRTQEPFDPVEDPQVCDRADAGNNRQWTNQEKALAREWFRNHVWVYVLGLLSDLGRWNMISERLKQLQIYATHINGVDMRPSGALADAKAAGWVPKSFNFSRAQAVAYRPEQNMGSILGMSAAMPLLATQLPPFNSRMILGLQMTSSSGSGAWSTKSSRVLGMW